MRKLENKSKNKKLKIIKFGFGMFCILIFGI